MQTTKQELDSLLFALFPLPNVSELVSDYTESDNKLDDLLRRHIRPILLRVYIQEYLELDVALSALALENFENHTGKCLRNDGIHEAFYRGGVLRNNPAAVSIDKIPKIESIKTIQHWFNLKKHGGREKALIALNRNRARISNILGRTVTYRVFATPAHVAEYVTGFFDGDGTIVMSTGRYVGMSQSSDNGIAEVLLWIQRIYGGKIGLTSERDDEWRESHRIYWTPIKAIMLLRDMVTRSIVKRPQIQALLDYLNRRLLTPFKLNESMKELRPLQDTLEYWKQHYERVEIEPARLTWAYMGGLFDAEGCVMIHRKCKSLIVSITQASCPRLLEEMSNIYGTPGLRNIHGGSFHLQGENARNFLRRIRPFTIQKRAQIDVALRHLDYCDLKQYRGCKNRYNLADYDQMAGARSTLKRMKKS